MSFMCMTKNERIWHLLDANMQFTYTQNGVHQHWISNCREFQRMPESASTCLFANRPHARFFGLPSWTQCLASCERRHRRHCALDVTAVLSLACGLFASLGRHLSLVPWVQANALSVNTQMPILTEKHVRRHVEKISTPDGTRHRPNSILRSKHGAWHLHHFLTQDRQKLSM